MPRNVYALICHSLSSITLLATPLSDAPSNIVPLLIITSFVTPVLFLLVLMSPFLLIPFLLIGKDDIPLRFEDYVEQADLVD